MKKKLIVFACFLLVSLSCLPQLPVRLNERSVVLNTSTGALKGKMVTPNQESGYPVVLIIPGSGWRRYPVYHTARKRYLFPLALPPSI